MISLPSEPMPGENGEKFEAGENTGENLNPYFDEGAWSNMEGEPSSNDEKYDDAVSKEIVDQIENGSVNLDNVKDSVNENYIDGAIESSSHELDIEGSKDMIDDPDDDKDNEKIKAAEVAAGATAISALDGAETAAKTIRYNNDVDTTKIKEDIQKAKDLAEKTTTLSNSGEISVKTAAVAEDIAAQASEMAAKAEGILNEAEAERAGLSEEEKALDEAAAETAETEGITIEEAKDKIEAESGEDGTGDVQLDPALQQPVDDNWTPDLSGAIFGNRRK